MNVFPRRPGSRPTNLAYFSEKRQKVLTLFYYKLFSFACTDFSKSCMPINILTDMQGVCHSFLTPNKKNQRKKTKDEWEELKRQ